MQVNKSGIHPVGCRILVEPLKTEETTASGIVISHGEGTERESMANTTGTVVELGSDAFYDEKSPWCKVGDKIIFAKYAGVLYVGKDKKKYRVMNDKDVTGVLDSDVDYVDPHLSKGL